MRIISQQYEVWFHDRELKQTICRRVPAHSADQAGRMVLESYPGATISAVVMKDALDATGRRI